MKRNTEHGLNEKLDLQLDHLVEKLRDTGIPPGRDLWPEIDQAIRRTDLIPTTTGRRLAGWRIVALAASVLLLVGVGLVQHGDLPGNSVHHQAGQSLDKSMGPLAQADLPTGENAVDVPVANLKFVDQALADLNQALAADPNNSSLSQLVLMIHKSRGNLIRNTVRRLAAPGG
ncbi:MAG: hypothetical protein KOO60_12355 [Gemmatimonadales bacterium]|nr:hypothetical protein [Gemmatimonadales bacterium]